MQLVKLGNLYIDVKVIAVIEGYVEGEYKSRVHTSTGLILPCTLTPAAINAIILAQV